MKYEFEHTELAVENDEKVQLAAKKTLSKIVANGTLKIMLCEKELKKGVISWDCKISGAGLGKPVMATGARPNDALNDAAHKVKIILNNEKQTARDKKEHANNKARKKANEDFAIEQAIQAEQEDDFGL